jgi:hypothetical protein
METEYMGSGRAKMWTYFILAVVLVVGIIVANFAMTNEAMARDGVEAFLGLPGWAFPAIVSAGGMLLFLLGLKLETDWPEGLGAMLVAGGLAWGEFMLGWDNFEVGGMVVVPYALPVLVFLALMGWSMVSSK